MVAGISHLYWQAGPFWRTLKARWLQDLQRKGWPLPPHHLISLAIVTACGLLDIWEIRTPSLIFSLQDKITISFHPFLHLLTRNSFAGYTLVLEYVRWSVLIHLQPTVVLWANNTACFKSGGFYCQIPAPSSVFPVECWWHPVSSLPYHWHGCVSCAGIPRGCYRSKDLFSPLATLHLNEESCTMSEVFVTSLIHTWRKRNLQGQSS